MKDKKIAYGLILLGLTGIAYSAAKKYPEKEQTIMTALGAIGGLTIGIVAGNFILGKYQLQ